MTCVHLKELYRICQQHELKLTSGDLIHIVCPTCGLSEVCPSAYASAESDAADSTPPAASPQPPAKPSAAD